MALTNRACPTLVPSCPSAFRAIAGRLWTSRGPSHSCPFMSFGITGNRWRAVHRGRRSRANRACPTLVPSCPSAFRAIAGRLWTLQEVSRSCPLMSFGIQGNRWHLEHLSALDPSEHDEGGPQHGEGNGNLSHELQRVAGVRERNRHRLAHHVERDVRRAL